MKKGLGNEFFLFNRGGHVEISNTALYWLNGMLKLVFCSVLIGTIFYLSVSATANKLEPLTVGLPLEYSIDHRSCFVFRVL